MGPDQIQAIVAARKQARTVVHSHDGVDYTIELPAETEFVRAMSTSTLIVDQVQFISGCVRAWTLPMSALQPGAPDGMTTPCLPELVLEHLRDNFPALQSLADFVISKHLERKRRVETEAKNSQPGSTLPAKNQTSSRKAASSQAR
jgi:hypothetical protein